MMSAQPYEVPLINAQAFSAAMHDAYQEKKLMFKPYMTPYQVPEGYESFTYNLNETAADARFVTERFGVTDYQEIGFRKRTIRRKEIDVAAIPITREERKSILFTPQQVYVQQQTNSIVRKKNQMFFDAFEAAVPEIATLTADGAELSTNVTFDSGNIVKGNATLENGLTVGDVAYAGSETSVGLTPDKISILRQLAEDNKVLGDEFDNQYGNQLIMLVTEEAVSQLEESVKASNKDYSHLFTYDAGMNRVSGFKGVKFHYYSSNKKTFTNNSETIQRLYAWHPSAFIFHDEGITPKVAQELPERKHNGHVYAYSYHNIVRVREEAAFAIDIKVS